MTKKENYYVPETKYDHMRLDCAMKDLQQNYHFKAEQDLIHNVLDFTVGYNYTDEYDSSFFLTLEDSEKLLEFLTNVVDRFKKNDELLDKATKFIADLSFAIESGTVKTLNIECIEPSKRFGSIVLNISYNNKSAIIMSENIIDFDIEKNLDNLKKNHPEIKVTFNSDKYHELYKDIKESSLNKNAKKFGMPKEIEKQSLDDITKSILESIDKNKKL